MKNRFHLTLALVILVCGLDHAFAQTSLNEVKIGQCGTDPQITSWINDLETTALVIDARPFAINQATGNNRFSKRKAQVSVVHMNPFVYDYKISVAQQELVSTALTDFLKLALPQSLSALPGLQAGKAGAPPADFARNKIDTLDQRLLTAPPNLATCLAQGGVDANSCNATLEMRRIFHIMRTSFVSAASPLAKLDAPTIITPAGASSVDSIFALYTSDLTALRNEEARAYETCHRGQQLNTTLAGYNLSTFFTDLNNAQKEISKLKSLADDLEQLANDYKADTQIKDKIVRCSGFSCTTQFLAYATAVKEVIGGAGYQLKLNDLRTKGQEMQNMLVLTNEMGKKEGLFARTFEVKGKFELSQATVSVKREKIEPKIKQQTQTTAGTQAGTPESTGSSVPGQFNSLPGSSSEGTAGNQFGQNVVPDRGLQAGTPAAQPTPSNQPPNNAATALTGDVNEVIQLGRPRFMLSGGMVYSPLPRRTFKVVKGFVLDAQGNPTGNGDTSVVGFDQNSPRRLFPMLFLNSRMLDYGEGSLYLSLGITAKHDDNVDLEYLVGPSFSFLNDRALFTFGAYGGLTQKLVSDVRIGQEIPDSLGSDVALFRKGLTWKPGFSFSYAFSRTKKSDKPPVTSGNVSPTDDLKNEIRIGSIPFNLAVGLAYTSLEQRTYDKIAGFARNRQGALTNGQTLARIVGVTSSSNYRLSPLAMLHSRLTNFGSHDIYFTSGITGKKTDNDFDIEYLLGGSVNLYRRKVFLTFGTFAGKQQILGGNFFEGAALSKSQNVPTEKRYVWKPAIAFSYDISRILPR